MYASASENKSRSFKRAHNLDVKLIVLEFGLFNTRNSIW